MSICTKYYNQKKSLIMKKLNLNFTALFMAAIVLAAMVSSCGSSKKLAQMPEDEVLVNVYCSGPEYQTNAEAFRYSAIGESMNQMTAKNKAMSEARAGLAQAINTIVKGVTDNYVKSGNYNNQEELMQKYEGLTREVVNQSLSGTKVICEEMTKTRSGNYKSYLCLELGGDDVLSSIQNRVNNEEMLKIDYNYEKFKKIYEEEMKKFEQ